jgi:glycosyltransferase involved in cell wall biosynthesis
MAGWLAPGEAVTMLPAVSVIVPTMALPVRAGLIRRALESVLSQQGVRPVPIVVVNGGGFDPALVVELERDPRLRVFRRSEAGLPEALAAGLAATDTEWVSALDDDDRLLPGALARRVAELAGDAGLDVVVTGGLRSRDGVEVLHDVDAEAVARDPVRAFFDRQWLLPGSWLARTSAVKPWLFDGMARHLECAFLALRFGTQCRMRYLPEPTVVWYTDSPESASRSPAYRAGQYDAVRALRRLPLPPDARRRLADHARVAAHQATGAALRRGELREAWRMHFLTLRTRGGWRHLPYARHLLAATLGGWKAGRLDG